MKKLFLSLVFVFLGITGALAQGSMLATLTHEGEVTTFYGASALKDAHAAAVHGDVVTLSSGTFVATNITKAITVRGAGMGLDAGATSEPTVITGYFDIKIPEDVTQRLTLEGIYHNQRITYVGTLKNAMFLKCRLNEIYYSYNGGDHKLIDASFIHCRIATELDLTNNSSASCVNCVIQEAYTPSAASFEFVNCVIRNGNLNNIQNSSFKNCILISNSSSNGYVTSSCTAYNCVYKGSHSNPFQYITNSTNVKVGNDEELFKTYKGESLSKLDSETFELTDAAKAKYLSMDGTTQVGIYGGNLPFDPVPTNPQITKCNVAAKSTADGKLSVDIQINSEQ